MKFPEAARHTSTWALLLPASQEHTRAPKINKDLRDRTHLRARCRLLIPYVQPILNFEKGINALARQRTMLEM